MALYYRRVLFIIIMNITLNEHGRKKNSPQVFLFSFPFQKHTQTEA